VGRARGRTKQCREGSTLFLINFAKWLDLETEVKKSLRGYRNNRISALRNDRFGSDKMGGSTQHH
jgi:hypothetical protein